MLSVMIVVSRQDGKWGVLGVLVRMVGVGRDEEP